MIGGDKSNDDHDDYGHSRQLVVQSLHSMSPLSGLVPKLLCRRNSLGAAPGHSRFWQKHRLETS